MKLRVKALMVALMLSGSVSALANDSGSEIQNSVDGTDEELVASGFFQRPFILYCATNNLKQQYFRTCSLDTNKTRVQVKAMRVAAWDMCQAASRLNCTPVRCFKTRLKLLCDAEL